MWVIFEDRRYRLPMQARLGPGGFKIFQEKNRNCEVVIYAPEGGHDVVPIVDLEFLGEDREYERHQ
jgi:hypothetical protein